MRDDDNDSFQETPNPFRRGGVGWRLQRRIGQAVMLLHRATRPLRHGVHWLGRGAGLLARGAEDYLMHFGGSLERRWHRLTRRVPLDAVRRQVSSLQDSAARSVDDLTHSVREHTTHATWMRRLRARIAALAQRTGHAWIRFVIWAERSWLTRVLTAPLRWAARAGYTVVDFLIGWIATRQYRHLLFGIPAIVLVMPLAYCAVRLPFYTPEAKARHYRRAASEALAAGDHPSAELYFRKLAQLGDVHEQVTWRAALLAEEKGELDDAYRQLQQIAPLEEPGLPEAHLWIAQNISAGKLESGNPRATELVERHLHHAMARQAGDPTLNVWLARIYFSSGRREECRELLDATRVADLPWRARVGAADLYAQLGQLERARFFAHGALAYFDEQQRSGGALTVDDYLSWAAAAELEGETSRAIDVLIAALETPEAAGAEDDADDERPALTEADKQRLRTAVAELGLAHFDYFQIERPEDWDLRLAFLERLLPVLPDPEPGLQRLVQLTLLPEVAERAERMIAAHEAAGPLPAAVEKTRGDVAIINGRWDDAREHYRRAVERAPTQHAALNNLAYLMGHQEPRDLEQAITLANQAVALEPENPHYLETRGQLLVELERWQEAVADLTLALNGMPTKREIHASLARAYEQLGEHETAQLHAAQSGSLP
jgi:tetratricopeptide (TPR) repeat protein